ncbi:hypothetical protein [Falsiroseomonas sp.]|uniref:hypothetical protein n=1 Tax=Falsiroseomonas sp. TaxID=2870721 RepID=UPI003F6E56D8
MDEADFDYAPGGEALVIVFSSFGIPGAAGSTALAQPRFEFVRTLAARRIACLFVRDRVQHWYHSGIQGLSPDIPGTAARLADYAARHRRSYTMGHSMGGYAAMLFAELCGLAGSIATAPQTSITAAQRRAWKDFRWLAKVRETQASTATPNYLDLRDTLAGGRSGHRIFVSKGEALDSLHARHVADLPCVTVEQVEAADHNTARAIRRSGRLDALLDQIGA